MTREERLLQLQNKFELTLMGYMIVKWDDHMGNTECGYYVNIPFPYGIGKKRIYVAF